MSDRRPTICLNMIVRNEAHVVHEVLDSVAPYISSWVIVDTGSNDGTQDKIRNHMAALGIPGELHERPWRNFGHNRSEALELARARADYIWVMDADDIVVGTPDFGDLTADVYQLHYGPGVFYWRRQLFRDGMPWRYVGVLHEYADCDAPFNELRLDGDYYIESRRLGGRNLDPEKYARDAEILLAEVNRNPEDARSVFYLAQSYFDYGDVESARHWYSRRAEMTGYDEETYYSLARVAECMLRLGEPWPEVQDAYLRAWEYRPTRAEPLYSIASWYRGQQRYQLGYLFAKRAAAIPVPEADALFVATNVYTWRAADELAVCGSWVGEHEESFALCRTMLARDDIPEEDRQRIAGNRDVSVPALVDNFVTYPENRISELGSAPFGADVTVTVVAGPDRSAVERTLNSFIRCASDISRITRILVADMGLWPEDRSALRELYPAIEFRPVPPGARPMQIRSEVSTRYWLYLGMGYRFFAADDYIRRLSSILDAEPDVQQVGINFRDASKPEGAVAALDSVRRSEGTGRYVLAESPVEGPAMFDCARWPGPQTPRSAATLDEVLCVLQG
ncbi:glycosyltransferase [Mycolicibacterium parafortuitum]|uniref:Glycosyl transferase, group 2 family protein [Waddlia chondrophila WSU 86-1044] n=1 Tax=Mycolicibacterium parafortuitum TaxID=39692 RepID=A0A375YGS4_MYCPF|nr:glycosyltransferase [Mycolicibacterium parafortuitum]ORB27645.1 glycosyl transferase [Mycolicibacterium parafortuitum]SRX80290.1 glycosyl transferase, group 2 family protein [Waddlia chondrophila WSU 86-1044] [Mycolicibacterium parafortuitum]